MSGNKIGMILVLDIPSANYAYLFKSRLKCFRADWDSFFRENKNMNEMKAGERPDTIHFENLPCKWFVNYQDKSGVAHDKPSEFVLKKTFQAFGDIRLVDIPMLDPYRWDENIYFH